VKNLLLEYPTWFVIFCPLVGLAFGALLYFQNSKGKSWSRTTLFSLAALRFTVVALLVFLLLGPLLRKVNTEIEPPVIVLAVDQSSSLTLNSDSAEVAALVQRTADALNSKVGEKYEVVPYSFGASVREGIGADFKDEVTNISELMESLKARYTNRNLGAVVLMSDGIYNRGSNPRYDTGGLGAPIYSIALGDTTPRRDALISEVAANRIAFLGNTFPVEAVFRGIELRGENLNYQIEKDGQVLERGTFTPSDADDEKVVRFLLKADKPGVQRYTLRLNSVSGEQTLANNVSLVFIDVIDSRQKVLILAAAPHPDVFAIRSAIGGNENYEVAVRFAADGIPNLSEYDLVVLHQLPSLSDDRAIRLAIVQAKKPIFQIIGADSDLRGLTEIGIGISLAGGRNAVNDVKAGLNKSFTLFQPNERISELLADAPPLRVPFGIWRLPGSASIFLKQQVGKIATDDPLLVFTTYDDRKNATLLGEGIWRWRLADFAKNENHEIFDEFIGQIIQYLSLKQDKRLFRVQAPRDLMQNERIVLSAELYDAAYSPVNDAEVTVDFTDEEDKTYNFNFSRTETAYRLDAGMLPVGTYTFAARTNRDGRPLSDGGSFTIRPFAIEAARLRADHQLLYTLSQSTGGELYYPSEIDEMAEAIAASDRIQPVSFSTEKLSSMLNLFWPLVLLILGLSAEWFIRKRSGNY